MTFLHAIYRRYRAWEDGYIAMLDALNAGRPVDPSWSRTAYRRLQLRNCSQMSPVERAQMRDFIVRYRGWQGWAWLAGIIAFNCLIGLLLHLAAPARFGLAESMALVNLLVFATGFGMLASWFGSRKFSAWRPRTLLVMLLLAIAGAFTGGWVASLARGESLQDMLQRAGPAIGVGGLIAGALYAAAFALVVSLRNRELAALNARLASEAERQKVDGQLALSRLRLLQAQIEPHFLFNTLGAVQQLAEKRAPDAASLTSHLIRFLRGSIGGFRDEAATLGSELALVASYLEIMRSRLGQRLVYRIDVAEGLERAALRPTLLITLVENAIKHGIEPAPAGGAITIVARADAGRLRIDVADTGAGMSEVPGAGQGLDNVRQQLALAYGGRASLELFDNEPAGFVARLILPLEPR